MYEQHPVGVLLNGTRVPQVGELGPVVASGLAGPVELGQHQHGDLQLPGNGLDAPGDLRDVLIAAGTAPALLRGEDA